MDYPASLSYAEFERIDARSRMPLCVGTPGCGIRHWSNTPQILEPNSGLRARSRFAMNRGRPVRPRTDDHAATGPAIDAHRSGAVAHVDGAEVP